MNNNTKFIAGILIGAAAGAAVAYLLTSDKGKDILSSVKEYAEKATDEVSNLFAKGKDAMNEAKDKYTDVTA